MDKSFLRELAVSQRQFKYGNRPVGTGKGRYHSKAEMIHSLVLEDMLKKGEIKEWDRQVKFSLYGKNGHQVTTHIVDFVITHLDGRKEVHEVKGFATAEWGIKQRLFEDNYPEIEYSVIDARNYYR